MSIRAVVIWPLLLLLYIFIATFSSYYLIYPSLDSLTTLKVISSGVFFPSQSWYPDDILNENGIDVTLPDDKSIANTGLKRGWYKFSNLAIDKNEAEKRLYILFPKISQNIEVFVNNKWIGNGGRMKPPVYRNRSYPLLFPLDRELLFSKDNTIMINLVGQAGLTSYLGEFYIGAEEDIIPIYEKNKFVRVNLIFFSTTALISFSLFLGILWSLRKKEKYYLWFSLALLLWALHSTNNFWRMPLISDRIWEAFVPWSFGFVIVFFLLFIHRIEGGYNKKIDKIIPSFMILLSFPFFYSDIEWVWFYGYNIWFFFVGLIGLYSLYFLFRNFRKNKNPDTYFMFLIGISIFYFGIHDMLVTIRVLDSTLPFMLYLSSFLVLIFISNIILSRLIDGINVIERYNIELEGEILKRQKEMENNYLKIQDLNKEKVLSEERERIMLDMHDGIGGNLVAIMAGLDSSNIKKSEIKNSLDMALQDLRIMIDSLDNSADDLPTVLGMLRMRLSKQLEKSGLNLVWKVGDLPEIDGFGPEKALHTMRILQEAANNAAKYSKAKNLEISTHIYDVNDVKSAVIKVKDDGNGVIPPSSKGRGLSNMHYRAKKIEAYFRLNADPENGVTIIIAFPIESPLK